MTDEELLKLLREKRRTFDEFAAWHLAELAANRIEELVSALRLVQTDGLHIKHARRADTTEARLAKAVDALRKMADGSSDNSEAEARAVLAEIGGES